ncbi:MAG: DNA cytosine methyltransferase, partial [Fusobacteriaceae bacterium]
RNENDTRNKLYERMVQLAKEMKPKAVIIENVPGLATLYNGVAKKQILEDFRNLGYTMSEPKILYAPDYGVPQIRKRLFFVGLLNSNTEFKYPDPICKEENYITCEQAISDLPSLEKLKGKCPMPYSDGVYELSEYQKFMKKKSQELRNHIGSIHTEQTKYLISKVPEGKTYKALPDNDPICKEYKDNAKYNELLTRYHSKKPSLTINTGHRTHFHYKYHRIPTVRENARLQSFPDDFIFCGNKAQQYRQVGNAVPPLLGYHLGLQLKNYLKNLEEFNNEKI